MGTLPRSRFSHGFDLFGLFKEARFISKDHIEAGRDSEGGELHGEEEGLPGELERCERERGEMRVFFFIIIFIRIATMKLYT